MDGLQFLSSSQPSFSIIWKVAKVVYIYLCCNYTATSACICTAYLPIEELINSETIGQISQKIYIIDHFDQPVKRSSCTHCSTEIPELFS